MQSIFKDSNGRAGSRSIADINLTRWAKISRYRVTKIMKKLSLNSCKIRKYTYKRGANERVDTANHLQRQFPVEK